MQPDDYYDYDDGGEWVDCWACFGEGYFHNCGDDTCVCLHPETQDMDPCEECEGKGGWRVGCEP